MHRNDSSQVRNCMNQTDKPSAGETSQNDSRNTSATHQPSCSECGAGRVTNTPQRTEHQSMGEGSAHTSSLNTPLTGGRTGDTQAFSKLNKLQACDMDHLSFIKDHTVLIDVRLHLNIMWSTVRILIVSLRFKFISLILLQTRYLSKGLIAPHTGKVFWDGLHVKLPHMYVSIF